jgi:hypothetical protein
MRPGCAICGDEESAEQHTPEWIQMFNRERSLPRWTEGHHEFVPRTPLANLDMLVENVCRTGRGEETPPLDEYGHVMNAGRAERTVSFTEDQMSKLMNSYMISGRQAGKSAAMRKLMAASSDKMSLR